MDSEAARINSGGNMTEKQTIGGAMDKVRDESKRGVDSQREVNFLSGILTFDKWSELKVGPKAKSTHR